MDATVQDVSDGRVATSVGIVIALTGLVMFAWPAATVVVVGLLLGAAMILYGVKELSDGIVGSSEGSRLVALLIGFASVLAGAIVALSPLLTAVTVGTLVGVVWLTDGMFKLIGAFVEPTHRIVRAAVGLLSLVAGASVLVQPALSLVVLTWFAGAWMVVVGAVVAGRAWLRRRDPSASVV